MKFQTLFRFLYLLSNVLLSLPVSHSRHHITFTCHIFLGSSCLWWWCLRLSLFLMILTDLRVIIGQMFHRMYLSLGLSDAVLMARLCLWVLRGRPRDTAPFLPRDIKSTYYRCDWSLLMLILTTGLKQWLLYFFHRKVIISLPFLIVLFGKMSVRITHM